MMSTRVGFEIRGNNDNKKYASANHDRHIF